MASPGRISSTYAQILYEYIENMGLDAETILGLPRPPVDPTGRSFVQIETLNELYVRADQYFQDPALGIRVGATIEPRHIGLVGYLLANCSSVAHAMYRHNEFERLYWDCALGSIRPHLYGARISWKIDRRVTTRHIEVGNQAAMVAFVRKTTGSDSARPYDVHFAFPKPADVKPYEDFFQCPVYFDSPRVSIAVSYSTLLMPLRKPDESLFQVLEQQAKAYLKSSSRQEGFTAQLVDAMGRLLPTGQISLDRCADAMHLSSGALQKKLDGSGKTFPELLDETRMNLADAYLLDHGLRLAEIAILLGYSDQAAFTRAFNRWYHTSPARWKRENKNRRAADGDPATHPR